MGNMPWKHIILEGWPVLSVLFVTSILSFAVMIEKWKEFSKIQMNVDAFLESIKKSDVQKVISFCQKSDQPLAAITLKILLSPLNRDDKERNLDRALGQISKKLEHHVSFLGTVASVAPFIGLLGTVIGIIKSFHAVAATTAGGASQVSIGIAEALVGTAAGLVVAIPAVLAYNFFVNKIRVIMHELELAGGEVIDWALDQGRAK